MAHQTRKHSGDVTTGRIGSTWSPIDSLTFRGTLSRDIRAPSLDEMFSPGGGGVPGIINPFRNGISENTLSSTTGNPALEPEESDYTGFGVIVQPSFLPGFSASVDYWDIDITGAIGTTSVQQTIDFCYEGKGAAFCDALDFGPNQEILLIRSTPFNLDSMMAKGLDIEARYSFAPADIISAIPGDMTFSYQASHTMEKVQTTATGQEIQLDGQNTGSGVPEWRWKAALGYNLSRMNANLTVRGISRWCL